MDEKGYGAQTMQPALPGRPSSSGHSWSIWGIIIGEGEEGKRMKNEWRGGLNWSDGLVKETSQAVTVTHQRWKEEEEESPTGGRVTYHAEKDLTLRLKRDHPKNKQIPSYSYIH